MLTEEEKALLHQSLYEDYKKYVLFKLKLKSFFRREELKKARELAKRAEEEKTLADLKTVGATKGLRNDLRL